MTRKPLALDPDFVAPRAKGPVARPWSRLLGLAAMAALAVSAYFLSSRAATEPEAEILPPTCSGASLPAVLP